MAKKKKLSRLAKQKANPSSMYWRRRADKAWADAVKKGGKCEVCGSKKHLIGHHMLSKERLYYRHNIDNGLCVCSYCHKGNKKASAHGSTDAVYNFIIWLHGFKHAQFRFFDDRRKQYHETGIKYNYQKRYEALIEMCPPPQLVKRD